MDHVSQHLYKENYGTLNSSELSYFNDGEYYPNQFSLNSYYPAQNFGYEYNVSSETGYNLNTASHLDTADINSSSFWSPRRKFYTSNVGQSSWIEGGAIPQSETSFLGSSAYTTRTYNHRQNPLAIDTGVPRAPASYGGNYTSPRFKDELEKISPRRQAGSHVSPTSKNQSNKRNAVAPDGFVYQVQFKRAHRNFILAPSAPRDLLPGDFVKVEADRGEDMGIVLAKCPVETFEEVMPTAGYRGRGFSSGQGEKKYLFRRATNEERAALAIKVADEEKALEYIREKVAERGLPMQVLDAEYQYDRHKLTFFFEADRRIDFRDLVSELFSLYKTRIWMQQVDTSTVSPHDAGIELAKATGFLPERDEITSRRSSFTTSNEDPLSGGGSVSDFNETDQIQVINAFNSVRKTSKNSAEEFQETGANAFAFSDSWYTANYGNEGLAPEKQSFINV